MVPCEPSPNAVEIISAVGAVLTACVSLYLVHRRILADRDTRFHRTEETKVHEAVVSKLGVELAECKDDKAPTP